MTEKERAVVEAAKRWVATRNTTATAAIESLQRLELAVRALDDGAAGVG